MPFAALLRTAVPQQGHCQMPCLHTLYSMCLWPPVPSRSQVPSTTTAAAVRSQLRLPTQPRGPCSA